MAGPDLVADVLDAMVDLIDGHATLASYGERLLVRDGPPLADRGAEIEVWIGSFGQDFEDDTRYTDRWVTMGQSSSQREPIIEIPCAVDVYVGDTDMRTVRRTASDVLETIATILHGLDPLGLGQVLCGGVEIVLGTLRQIQAVDGCSARWMFTVRATART